MTTPESLPPELDDLLRAARPLDAAPDDARARLERRIALSVAAPAAAAAVLTAASHVRDAAPGLLSPLAQKLVIGVACFALGGGVGAGVHAALSRAPAPVVVIAQSAPRPPPPPPIAPPPAPDIPTVSANDLPLVPAPSTPARAAPAPAASTTSFAGEQALLDRARAALKSGDPGAALAPLDEHARVFPHGALVEEREALAIQALARSGRVTDAEERAVRFKKTFPNSLMAPAIDDAVRAARGD